MTAQSQKLDKSIHAEIIHLIVEKNISSIPIIACKVNLQIEHVQEIIQSLLSDNYLEGSISQDGTRFFKWGSRFVSSKPDPIEAEVQETMFTPGKMVFLSGIFMFIIGQLGVRIIPQETMLWEILSSAVVLSLAIILLGLFLFSKE